jgi:predicted GTPase
MENINGKNMINFYTLKPVQKYLEKDNDEQYKYTGMKILKHFLIVGKTGAGKSNCLLNYIYLTSMPKNGTFDHIFFVIKQMKYYINILRIILIKNKLLL